MTNDLDGITGAALQLSQYLFKLLVAEGKISLHEAGQFLDRAEKENPKAAELFALLRHRPRHEAADVDG